MLESQSMQGSTLAWHLIIMQKNYTQITFLVGLNVTLIWLVVSEIDGGKGRS